MVPVIVPVLTIFVILPSLLIPSLPPLIVPVFVIFEILPLLPNVMPRLVVPPVPLMVPEFVTVVPLLFQKTIP